MSVSKSFFIALTDSIKGEVKDKYVSKVLFFSKSDFFLCLSKDSKIFISLDNQNPIFALTEAKTTFPSIITPFSLSLKSELSGLRITDFKLINNDRILEITLFGRDDAYNDKTRYLVIELFSNHPNAILLNQERKIINCFHQSDLSSLRPIIRGLTYELPVTKYSDDFTSTFSKDEISYLYHLHDENHKDIDELINGFMTNPNLYFIDPNYSVLPLNESAKIIQYQDIFSNRIESLFVTRRKDKYEELIKFIKKQINHLSKRLDNISKDIKVASSHLVYKDYGDILLTYQYPLSLDDNEIMKIDNYEIPIDRTISIPSNAQKYYKLYQKAKKSISVLENLIASNQEELDYFKCLQEQIMLGNEDDIEEIKEELMNQNYLKNKVKSKSKKKEVSSTYPYFITYKGTKIGFGKNNLQNDYLTHKLAKNSDWFFHVESHPGSHVVVFSSSLSEDLITFASSLALFLSKVSVGNINYTQIKNIKRLSKPGLVSLKEYKTIYLKDVLDLSSYVDKASRH